MVSMLILCALLGVAVSVPTGYHVAPIAFTAPRPYYAGAAYQAAAPAAAYVAAASPAYVATGPIVTGTLHHTQDTLGNYKYGYTSSDGQAKTESKTADEVSGGFSYISPEGHRFNLNYVADKEGGFRAAGDHLPEAPEALDIPEDLAAAYREAHGRLAQAYEEARLRGDDPNDDGQYKPELYERPYDSASGSYQAYVARAPVSHAAAYQTYAAPAAFTATYGAAAPAAVPGSAAFASRPGTFGSVSYSTEIGGRHVAAPARLSAPAHLAAPAHKKSGYTY